MVKLQKFAMSWMLKLVGKYRSRRSLWLSGCSAWRSSLDLSSDNVQTLDWLIALFNLQFKDDRFLARTAGVTFRNPSARTGRAGKKGTAITLFTTDNVKQARDLVSALQESKQSIDPRLAEMARYSGGGGGGGR
ncbi:hypothetical protein AYL99_12006 [Fonsecaea erecta]|uniref:Uncharacterized protein n=1 Tax=Fonsecaea erecta TaxID=1367422 RepID=A0A178Z267_9EURO|nr:hypothetical protein AYL99_12006 [Fonsecaea erecta]OAP53787.1 hypothetical protein AYL99_12006 [Fonsecaea erecta]